MDEFPMRLRYLRERRGISRSTMSELVGLSKSMIAKYERGERQPTIEPLIELAEFFEVSVDFLCGRKNF